MQRQPEPRSRQRGLAAAWLATAVWIGAAYCFTGCTTHQCDSSSSDFFGGQMLDENTFVTSGWDDPWLPFPPTGTIRIWFPPKVAGRTARVPIALVGVDPTPNGGPKFVNGDNWTGADGQLAEYNFLQTNASVQEGHAVGGGFWVTNATCVSYYYARFEVDFVPVGPDAGVDDRAVGEGGDLDPRDGGS